MSATESHGFDPVSGLRYLTLMPHLAAPSDAVVVYLHGIGERGDDLAWVKKYGLPAMLAEGRAALNCPVVCPQLEAGRVWDANQVVALIRAVSQQSKSVVLMGYSLGALKSCAQ